jgi:4-amino-4-deoxy-L-arabinose transferase-like glycosyltransferase
VLNGELPHRDFQEIYTGGLSYLHAFAFVLFGENLDSLRLVLFAFFVAWVPALYALARRFTSPPAAGACVLACVAWSVPNYSASMPSWYNLFFATFAAVCLFRFLEERRARWLTVAGLMCGLSILVKPTGIYVVVAIFLVLLLDDQFDLGGVPRRRRSSVSFFVIVCGLGATGLLVALLSRRLSAVEAANFLVPGTCVAGLLVWSEVRARCSAGAVRLARVRPLGWFSLGVALPLIAFAIPYVATNSLGSLFQGVLIDPSARLEYAALKPLTLSSLPITVLVLTGLAGLAYAVARGRFAERIVALAILATWLVLTATGLGFRITWVSVRDASILLVPLGIPALGAAIVARLADRLDYMRAFALLAIFAFATLIQFPWSGPTYFYYVAPLMFVAALATASIWRTESRRALPAAAVVVVFVFLAAFGVVRVNDQAKGGSASGTSLGLARSGRLQVSAADSRLYRSLLARLQEIGASRYIYAGPDAPELYFLADRRNPTRASFEFFEHGPAHDGAMLQALERHDVSLIALNLRPSFSPPLDPSLMAALSARYPRHERIGRFELRWRG